MTWRPRPSITCPHCGQTSHHPGDIKHGYCGRCKWWTSDPQLGPLSWRCAAPLLEEEGDAAPA